MRWSGRKWRALGLGLLLAAGASAVLAVESFLDDIPQAPRALPYPTRAEPTPVTTTATPATNQ